MRVARSSAASAVAAAVRASAAVPVRVAVSCPTRQAPATTLTKSAPAAAAAAAAAASLSARSHHVATLMTPSSASSLSASSAASVATAAAAAAPVAASVLDAAGLPAVMCNTPLVRVNSVSDATGCEILGKCENQQPGGSVKDRAALYLLAGAEARGELVPGRDNGGIVVEGTAGNTGIALAHLAKARGYRAVFYLPDTQSPEKMDLLRSLGAEVRPVPVAPFTDPKNFNKQAKAFAEETEGAFWCDQFDNTDNRGAHVATTGPEIWAQCAAMGLEPDAFTCATGTGGTFAGTSQFLREVSDGRVQCTVADPPGSVLYRHFTEGKAEREGDGSITEGIGQGRITGNMEGVTSDKGALHVPDEETIAMLFNLIHQDGLYLGASAALNVVAARDLALKLGPGHTIVTILCDGAYRYQSRLFSKSWLDSKNLLHHVPEKYHAGLHQ